MKARIISILTIQFLALAGLKPILRLDPGGHTAMIKDVIVHPSGKYIISASDDKTIRVWRVLREGGEISDYEERNILGRIGPGSEGKIYAIAISPDGKILAAGGFMEKEWGQSMNISAYTTLRRESF